MCILNLDQFNSATRFFPSILFSISSEWRILRAFVVVANADAALGAKTVRPEPAELDVGLRQAGVGQQEPKAEDRLGEDVKNGVSDDLSVHGQQAGTVSNAPDAARLLVWPSKLGDTAAKSTYIG